jgi:hypothetical protein
MVIGRDVHETGGFDKKALNRSMKMCAHTMGPNTCFKLWKRNFITFLSLKPAYLIPQLAIHESGVGLNERAQNYAYALLLHVAIENKLADRAVKCVSAARPDYATAAWEILYERLNGRSFARSLSLLNILMLIRQRPA